MESTENYQLDNLDRSILKLLALDARIAYTEIAKSLLVSAGTIHVRMAKMEKIGVVKGTTLLLDATKMGYGFQAFIGIFLDKSSSYAKVIAALNEIPEVLEAHYTTGQYSIFTKLVCKDTRAYKDILSDKIQAIDGVARTETLISLDEPINRNLSLA